MQASGTDWLVIAAGTSLSPLTSLPFLLWSSVPSLFYFSFGFPSLTYATYVLLGKVTPLSSTDLAERCPLLSFGLSRAHRKGVCYILFRISKCSVASGFLIT